jgi:hypothetical protein
MTDTNQSFDILDTPYFQEQLKNVTDEVEFAAAQAEISPFGFTIDKTFCDWRLIKVQDIYAIIDDAAEPFGSHGQYNYHFFIDALCEAVTEHFSKEKYKPKKSGIVTQVSENQLDDFTHATHESLLSHGINIGEDNLVELNGVIASFLTEHCGLATKSID